MDSSSPAWKALHEAFPRTIPIFAGFWFLAFAYGFYMYTLGFSFIYPTLMAMIIFGGSLEFVTVSMLLSPFAPWQALVVALTVQARHLFYGLSMLEKYKGTGWKKPFLIFWMCDETFALNYSSTIPYDVDRGWYYFWVSFLNYFYWVSGALLGGLLGTVIQFNTKGLSFVMTSMFLVIFLEQWLKEEKHFTALIGLGISLGALYFFGGDSFIIPAMAGMMLVLTIFRKPLEKAGGFL
ncbi:AzlC family ABC transporter permease [uncultured Dialister sp.]|uniref:AzlC family ABC transporter permease n=1 Tax=uncultured Dialister sp. TaxID=278064 RepID=UPI00261B4C62|nr:AzlC family ABC transporter permease [uncultured Dialister sp.]